MGRIIDRDKQTSRNKKREILARFGLKSDTVEQKEASKIDIYAKKLALANNRLLYLSGLIFILIICLGGVAIYELK